VLSNHNKTRSEPPHELSRRTWLAAILVCGTCLLLAGCGGDDGGGRPADEQATAQTNEVIECVTQASQESDDNIADERLHEVAGARSLEDLRPAPTGYRAFAQSEAVDPPLLELYVFADADQARRALSLIPDRELPRTSSDIEANSVGATGNVIYRFVAGHGPERVTDQDAIRCLGRLPEPKQPPLPGEIAEQGERLIAAGFTAGKPLTLPPAQLEADQRPPLVSVPFTRGDNELVLAYFGNAADWQASQDAMKRTNRELQGTNSYAACGGHRIYLSLTGRDIRASDIETAEGRLGDCKIESP
jgi:hypothetical protein